MAQTNVVVRDEVSVGPEDEWRLCLQWVLYVYPDHEPQDGYRFIWRRPDGGALQAARGQARLPSLAVATSLMEMARTAGWGDRAAVDAHEYL